MALERVDLASLTMAAMAHGDVDRTVLVTSEGTGNPTMRRLRLESSPLLVSMQYSDPSMVHRRAPGEPPRPRIEATLADQQRFAREHSLAGSFDLAVVDPFHSYSSSVACLLWSMSLVRDGGVVLVHDCLPRADLATIVQTKPAWCGLTFEAFRNVCLSGQLEWCTANADLGVGMARVDHEHLPESLPSLSYEELDAAVAAFAAHPLEHMRAVDSTRAMAALAHLQDGGSADDFRRDHPQTGPIPTRTPRRVRQFRRFTRRLGGLRARRE